MAWCIKKRHLAAVELDAIRANMLGDTTMFMSCDVGLADRIKERGFTVIDVAHDRHNWRARPKLAFVFHRFMTVLENGINIEGNVFNGVLELVCN